MNKKKLVVLTGAGISAESGLKTFRDSDGLWEGYNIEDVATPRAWRRDPQLVLDFLQYAPQKCSRRQNPILHISGLQNWKKILTFISSHKISTTCTKEPARQKFYICMVKYLKCEAKRALVSSKK
jgi:NAD-dependent SIR2 family protein deacetylase